MRLFLSPSSQVQNQYAAGGTTEGNVCRQIAEQLKTKLEAFGHTVGISLDDSIAKRVEESNAFGADYHICIHTNAGGGDGTLVLCWPGNQEDKYVKAVYTSVAAYTPGKDDGIRPTRDLYEIKKTKAKCIYVECEYHDNVQLALWILSNIGGLASAIASPFIPEGFDGVREGCDCLCCKH